MIEYLIYGGLGGVSVLTGMFEEGFSNWEAQEKWFWETASKYKSDVGWWLESVD